MPAMKSPIKLLSPLALVAVLFAATPSLAQNWETGDYGGNLKMTYYVPPNVDESPALVLSLHYCGGNATSGQGWFKSFADQYGFMVISPSAPNADTQPNTCWDSSPGRSGDRAQLAQMIDWAIENHNVDPARVFAAGASSGACMSQTMLASYPDKIAAASVLAGVPVGFWAGGNSCGVCNQSVANAQTDWAAKVISAGPADYNGSRGRIQLFHAAQDQFLGSGNFAVEVTQWSDVLGVTGEGVEEANSPRSGWTRTSYKNADGLVVVQGNWWGSSPADSHDLTSNINPALWNEVVAFFGLDMDAAPGGDTSGGEETGGSAPPVDSTGGEESSTTVTTTTTSDTTTSSAPTTTDTTTPAPTTTDTTPAPVTPTPVTPTTPSTTAPTSTPPTGSTSAPSGTDTTTTTDTGTASSPIQSDTSDAGCQCQLGGATGQPTGALAGLITAGVATLLRRRNRR